MKKRKIDVNELVCWLMSKQEGIVRQFLSGLVFVVFFGLVSRGNWYFVLAVMLSMVIHELGHASAGFIYGVKTKVMFVFPLGMVTLPKDEVENKKITLLSDWQKGWFFQAGPLFNLVLAVIGWFLNMYVIGWEAFGLYLLLFNCILVLFNLLPIEGLDGGWLFKLFKSSLGREEAKQLVVAVVILTGIVIALVITPVMEKPTTEILLESIFKIPWVSFSLILSLSMIVWGEVGKVIPGEYSTKEMSKGQIAIQFAFYVTIIFLVMNIPFKPLF